MTNKITVLVICKRSTFIKALQFHLPEYGIQVISICNNSSAGIASFKQYAPDVVMMDANWAGYPDSLPGFELAKQLKILDPSCKIIFTTNFRDPKLIDKIQQAGIGGYFYRDIDKALFALIDCVKKVYNGETWLPQ